MQFLDTADVKLSQIETGLLFIQHYLNRDCDAFDRPKMVGAVKADFAIKTIYDKHKRSKATRAMEEGQDIQADLDVRITAEQMDATMRECFCPTNSGVSALSELARIQTAAEIRHSHTKRVSEGTIFAGILPAWPLRSRQGALGLRATGWK